MPPQGQALPVLSASASLLRALLPQMRLPLAYQLSSLLSCGQRSGGAGQGDALQSLAWPRQTAQAQTAVPQTGIARAQAQVAVPQTGIARAQARAAVPQRGSARARAQAAVPRKAASSASVQTQLRIPLQALAQARRSAQFLAQALAPAWRQALCPRRAMILPLVRCLPLLAGYSQQACLCSQPFSALLLLQLWLAERMFPGCLPVGCPSGGARYGCFSDQQALLPVTPQRIRRGCDCGAACGAFRQSRPCPEAHQCQPFVACRRSWAAA